MSPQAALDRFFEHYYRTGPVQATFTGIHDHDGRLPDWSPDGLEAASAERRELRRALDAAGRVDDRDVREYPGEADLALADGWLEIQLAEDASAHFVRRNPALWTGEAIFGAIALVTRPFAPVGVRVDALIDRMRAIRAFLAGAQNVLIDPPPAWRERAIRECGAAVPFFCDRLPAWCRQDGVSAAAAEAVDLVAREAAGAFDAFSEWLRRAPAADGTSAAAGGDLLALLGGRGHWCSTPLGSLLQEARDALDAESSSLDRLSRESSPEGWPAVAREIAAHHPSVDDYLPRFARMWAACREAALTHGLVTWPDAPIRYVPIPEHTRDAALALYYLFYRSPAPFDRLPVHDYVVTPIDAALPPDECDRRQRVWNDAAITLNHVVHHGGLGHHVQNCYAARGRSRIGQVAAVDGASRIGMFSGGTLAEGWACYACDLIEEIGWLTPHARVAQQHTRVRLAARAVGDLELHTGQRTLDETAALYRERAGMAPEAAAAEAVKNSMFPGAAVMYWLGTRGLHELRREVNRREGASFTLRAFHDRVLQLGAIPVPLIARLMTRPEGA